MSHPLLRAVLCILGMALMVFKSMSPCSAQDSVATEGDKSKEHIALKVGAQSPESVYQDTLGRRLRLSDYRGRAVVLMFSANWCGPCKQMYPYMRDLDKRFGSERLAVLSVMADEHVESVHLAGAKGEINWRVVHDGPEGPIAQMWGVRKWPTLFVIDHHGVIQSIDPRGEDLDHAVKSAVKRRDSDPSAIATVRDNPVPAGPYFDPEKTHVRVPETEIVVVFARHLVFFDGEPKTWEAVKARMLVEKENSRLRWVIASTQGCPDPASVQRDVEAVRREMRRPQMRFAGLTEASSRRWDSIITAKDAIPSPASIRRGIVRISSTGQPAAKAQIVVVPRDYRGGIALHEGELHNSWELQWTRSNPDGRFELTPFEDEYMIVALHADGIALSDDVIPDVGAVLSLDTWATLELTAERIVDIESIMVTSTTETIGHPYFSLSGLTPTRKTMSLKVPPGQISVSRLVDLGEGVSSVKRLMAEHAKPGSSKVYQIPILKR